MEVGIDNSEGDGLQGWQWGVCHDDAIVSIGDEDVSTDPQADLDSLLSFTFQAIVVFDEEDDAGWTVGCLLSVFADSLLFPGDHVLYSATYAIDVDAPAPFSTEVEFCDTLGSPMVTIAVVLGV